MSHHLFRGRRLRSVVWQFTPSNSHYSVFLHSTNMLVPLLFSLKYLAVNVFFYPTCPPYVFTCFPVQKSLSSYATKNLHFRCFQQFLVFAVPDLVSAVYVMMGLIAVLYILDLASVPMFLLRHIVAFRQPAIFVAPLFVSLLLLQHRHSLIALFLGI